MRNSGKWGDCSWDFYVWGHLAISGGTASSVESCEDVPWSEIRESITSVSVDEPLTLEIGSSLAHLFDGCVNLKRANLSNIDTRGVVSFRSMFEGCENLTELDLSGFNTSLVEDMQSMFMNCEKLEQLDLSHFDTTCVTNMSWMFCGCENLRRLLINGWNTSSLNNMNHMFRYCSSLEYIDSDVFNLSGEVLKDDIFPDNDSDAASDEQVPDEVQDVHVEETPRRGVFGLFGRHAKDKRKAYESVSETYHQEEKSADDSDDQLIPQYEEKSGQRTSPEYDASWQEAVRSTEDVSLIPVHNGDSSRQIYAGAPFFVGPVQQIPPITFGQRLELIPPQVDRNNGTDVRISVELSPDGVNRWTQFDPDAILPVSGNGCFVRYRVENWIGHSVSDAVRITIRKADIDTGNVRWKPLDNPVYDGTTKQVVLVGMPEGLKPVYNGNTAIDAGEYTASAVWEYDSRNYNPPAPPEDFYWKITKADYFMPDAKWAYTEAYTYDGEKKQVVLEGLPEGIVPRYKDNQATEVGIYYAQAEFEYDENNYNPPRMILPCAWEIKKARLDMTDAKWEGGPAFSYDGNVKTVTLSGLPDGIIPHYTGNRGIECGVYTASAFFELLDSENYYPPEKMSLKWSIDKSNIDLSVVAWDYSEPFVYDGTVRTIALKNLPDGIGVRYYGNSSIEAGTYSARAELFPLDEANYSIMLDSMTTEWQISKADYDMGGVSWNYSYPYTYDGTEKSVELENLPQGVTADYENNCASNAGVYTAKASFRYDRKNYNEPVPLSCRWEIMKADIALSGTYWYTKTDCVYSGHEHSVLLAGIPDQIEVEYSGNTAVDAGEYYASAVAVVKDPRNYNVPVINGISWRIKKTFPNTDSIVWDYNEEFTYSGEEKRVSLNNVPKDFDIEYIGNTGVNAGEYTAIARFVPLTDNYEIPDAMSCHWSISKASYNMKNVFWNYSEALVYDGTEKTIELTGLPEGVYAEYSGNTGVNTGRYAATAKLSVADENNYNIPSINGISWSIEKASLDMSRVRWVELSDSAYDGSPKAVALEGLPDGVSAVYSGNTGVNVGTYTASAQLVCDERNYFKPEVDDYEWSISKGKYRLDSVRWEYGTPFTYNGQVKSVELVGYGSDVSVRYSMNKAVDAGEYEAVAYITLLNDENYEQPEPMKLKWVIEKATFDMSNVEWSYERAFTYSGTAHVVTLHNLPEGVWADYEQNVAVNVGEYDAVATFGVNNSENYVVPEPRSCQWEIRKANLDMSRTHWTYKKPLICNGSQQEVVLTGLPEGVKPVYSGNTATASGIYEASVEFTLADSWNFNVPKVRNLRWEIVKDNLDMSQVQWKYHSDYTYNGKEQSVVLEGLPPGVEATYFGNTATDAGVYEARVRLSVADSDRYAAPVFENLKWRIKKANYDMSHTTWNYCDSMFVYDGTRKTVELENVPKGVNVSYVGNTEIKAGEYLAMAYLSVEDPSNYNVPVIDSCRWMIKKSKHDISNVRWNYDSPFIYSGETACVELINLPEGVTARYSGNVAVNAGKYIASANLSVDVENYEIPIVPECRWEIQKAMPDTSNIRWDYSRSFIYDGRRKSVQLAGIPQGMSVTYRNNSQSAAGTYTAEAFVSMDDKLNYNSPEIPPLSWTIEKADFDLSNARWVKSGRYVYDGYEKTVWLKGVPDGVAVEYIGNRGCDAGDYVAEAILRYDTDNYNTIRIEPYSWSIEKSDYDMGAVSWNYTDNFRYDGIGKRVNLIGVPDGITPVYSGNYAVDTGEYLASAVFEYDERNYNEPYVEPLTWRIKKAKVDLSKVKWDYFRAFTYNGMEQGITLASVEAKRGVFDRILGSDSEPIVIGLPADMRVVYEGNTAVDAGVYTAKAIIIPNNPENYEEPEVLECRWEIKKANPDMSSVRWSYDTAFTYDGLEKSVMITGLPSGVTVSSYQGNTAVNVGTYIARAVFKVDPDGNFNQPEEIALRWKIEKSVIDMSRVCWSYDAPFEYDGKSKTVYLEGIPKEMSVTYINNTNSEPGTYVAKAILTYDQSSYRASEVPDCRWKIEKDNEL